MKNLLTAIQPTNNLTLGNYLGAIKPFAKEKDKYFSKIFVADLHSMTTRNIPGKDQVAEAKSFSNQIYTVVATYIACGIEPDSCPIFLQSQIPEHSEMNWLLSCYSYVGELSRMHQFKDKSIKQGQSINAGLFTYPVLMAGDILLYETNVVPVGEDQKQHIELARDIAVRINSNYGESTVVLPEAIHPPNGAKIMSLKNPEQKMSKSDLNTDATIFLTDSAESIMKKFKTATTDSLPCVSSESAHSPGIMNLIQIQAAILDKTYGEVLSSYVGKQYGYLKKETGELVVSHLNPISKKIGELLCDKSELDAILKKAKEDVQPTAQKTIRNLKQKMGFLI